MTRPRPNASVIAALCGALFLGWLGTDPVATARPTPAPCTRLACTVPVDDPRFRSLTATAQGWVSPSLLPPLRPAVRKPRPSPTPSATATPTPTPTPTPPGSLPIRGVIRKGQTDTSMSGAGFNTTSVAPYAKYLDALSAAGMKGLVWLGQWNKTACAWEYDDAWVGSHVGPIAGHPGVAAYWIGDEPSFANCPGAPAAFKERTDLLHSLDPGRPTFTVIDVADTDGERYGYYHWIGSVDIIAADVYPCSREDGCVFSKIDAAVAALKEQHVPRFWAVVQDFYDSYYAQPTPTEIKAQFDHWAPSGMEGYLVYRWDYFSDKPDHLVTYQAINASYA